MKQCISCELWFDRNRFPKRSKGRCETCWLQVKPINKSETTEYQREVWLKANYGMTPEDYSYLLDSQGGVCAICKRPSSERLRVDHNHLSGLVRGLLCRSCNAALGMLAADAGPEMIQSALEYVSQPPAITRKAQKYE